MKAARNGGYTVLEMMVVVAIIAIALALASLSMSTVFVLNVKECAKEIASELGKEKVSAMTRTGAVYLRLYKTDDGVFVDTYEDGVPVRQGIRVGKASVTITWFTPSNTEGTKLDSTGIILAFNKSDGSFMSIGQARALHDGFSPPYADEYFNRIMVSGSKNSRDIILWPQTGKIDLKA